MIIRTNRLEIEKGGVACEMLWANGKLIMADKSLGDVCRFLSKWYDVQIDICNRHLISAPHISLLRSVSKNIWLKRFTTLIE